MIDRNSANNLEICLRATEPSPVHDYATLPNEFWALAFKMVAQIFQISKRKE